MSTPLRYAAACFFALWVALVLFWLMTNLINRDGAGLDKSRQRTMMNFIRIDDQPSAVQQRRRERPKPPEKPKPAPQMAAVPVKQTPSPQAPPPDLPLPDFRPNLAMSGLPGIATPGVAEPAGPAVPAVSSAPVAYSQPLTPVSQIPPTYPRRAMLDGIAGWVRLTFTITETGSVRDIEVVEASPRRGVFDHEASRALSRWKFNPQTEDGKPVQATATITINFNLER